MKKLLSFILVSSTLFLSTYSADDNCTVTSYEEVNEVMSTCNDIVIDGITVPAGETLKLDLVDGAVVTFKGTTKFENVSWDGPLMAIIGNGITVQGAEGSILDGQGALYWDGLGGMGTPKPKFMRISVSNESEIKDINVLNCPTNCIMINQSHGLTIDNWNINCTDGYLNGGHNTDGFDITASSNIVIKNSVVINQDDCIAVNHGSDMHFFNLYCSGSHGLSLSVGMSKTNPDENAVSNIVFSNSTVVNSGNGIHIKTHTSGTTGYIKNVTYENIILSGVDHYGINIQEDYDNGGSTGTPKGNIPITNLQMINIKGEITDDAMPVYIYCGEGGCSDWTWSGINITGGEKDDSCNFIPEGYSC